MLLSLIVGFLGRIWCSFNRRQCSFNRKNTVYALDGYGIATHSNAVQHTATYCNSRVVRILTKLLRRCNTLQRTATHYNSHVVRICTELLRCCTTLQRSATHCHTLQHTATHGNTLQLKCSQNML